MTQIKKEINKKQKVE